MTSGCLGRLTSRTRFRQPLLKSGDSWCLGALHRNQLTRAAPWGAVTERQNNALPSGAIPAGAGSRESTAGRGGGARGHPRGRGEQHHASPPAAAGAGPSPRARGAARRPHHRGAGAGTIPAGAGSSPVPLYSLTGMGDHPRGRGEQNVPAPVVSAPRGPSPRARGAGSQEGLRGDVSGTIPAGAGSRCGRHRPCPPPGDHPRGRGEQAIAGLMGTYGWGPSPRARGAAYPSLSTVGIARDHPRGRGEQLRSPQCINKGGGPSPRARGAVEYPFLVDTPKRTIPAGAGSSHVRHWTPRVAWDHPRGRGEQTA